MNAGDTFNFGGLKPTRTFLSSDPDENVPNFIETQFIESDVLRQFFETSFMGCIWNITVQGVDVSVDSDTIMKAGNVLPCA